MKKILFLMFAGSAALALSAGGFHFKHSRTMSPEEEAQFSAMTEAVAAYRANPTAENLNAVKTKAEPLYEKRLQFNLKAAEQVLEAAKRDIAEKDAGLNRWVEHLTRPRRPREFQPEKNPAPTAPVQENK